MRGKLKILIPIAVALALVAAVIAYNNKVSAPRTSEVDPVPATGNVEDTADLLFQDVAAEDAIVSEAEKDLDILEKDSSDTGDLSEAYDDGSL